MGEMRISPLQQAPSTIAVSASDGVSLGDSSSASVASGASPILTEDFSTYSSTTNWLNDPRGIYVAASDNNTSKMALDQTDGVDIDGYSLTQCGKYSWAAGDVGSCEITIRRKLTFANISRTMWVEWYSKFSTSGNDGKFGVCPSSVCTGKNCDYKTIFFNPYASGTPDGGRSQVNFGTFGDKVRPANPDGINVYNAHDLRDGGGNNINSWDGSWHKHRVKVVTETTSGAGDGAIQYSYDGTLQVNQTGLTLNKNWDGWNRVTLGANMNRGPERAMSMKWGRVAVYDSDPAWSEFP